MDGKLVVDVEFVIVCGSVCYCNEWDEVKVIIDKKGFFIVIFVYVDMYLIEVFVD